MNTPVDTTAIEEVRQAERDWVALYLKNDADAFAAYLTDDFVYTSPVCEVVDRATYLRNLRDRTVVMQYAHPSDELIRVHGNTAIVTAAWDVSEAYQGQPFAGPCRITRVWLRERGRWRAAVFHVTECKAP